MARVKIGALLEYSRDLEAFVSDGLAVFRVHEKSQEGQLGKYSYAGKPAPPEPPPEPWNANLLSFLCDAITRRYAFQNQIVEIPDDCASAWGVPQATEEEAPG